jgi:hypothetical protein
LWVSVKEDQLHIKRPNPYAGTADMGTAEYNYRELFSTEAAKSWLYRAGRNITANTRLPLTHMERTLTSHITYLENFRIYVINCGKSIIIKYAVGENSLDRLTQSSIESRIKSIADSRHQNCITNALKISAHILSVIEEYNKMRQTITDSEEFYDNTTGYYYVGADRRIPDGKDFENQKYQWGWYYDRIETRKKRPLEIKHMMED